MKQKLTPCKGPGGKGCGCSFHTRAREASRRCAWKKRQGELEARQSGSRVCQRRQGSSVCGGVLEIRTDGKGNTVVYCPLCIRREAGICRDCPHPVAGRRGNSLRCKRHTHLTRRDQQRQSIERNRDDINLRARKSYQNNEAVRTRRNNYKRLWRAANPDKVRAAKQRYAKRHGCEKDSRYLTYHRRYNRLPGREQRKREMARAGYYRRHPVRPSARCRECNEPVVWTPGRGRPPLTCDRHCNKYALADRLATRANPAKGKKPAKAPNVPDLPRLRVRSHVRPPRYAASGQRLCVMPTCEIVVTGRRKKCTKCRRAEAERAKQQLAQPPKVGRPRERVERVA